MLIIQTLSASVSTEGRQKRSEKIGGAGGGFITNTGEIHCRATRSEENGCRISRALNEKKKNISHQANSKAAEYQGNYCELYLRASRNENKQDCCAVAFSGQWRKAIY